MRRQNEQAGGSRSLEARLHFQPGHSTALLNEYYHHEFSRGMESITRLTQLHDKIVIADKELEVNEQDELTWQEYNESRQQLKADVKKMKKQRKQAWVDQAKRQEYNSLHKGKKQSLRSELIEQNKYNRKKQHTPVKAAVPTLQPPPLVEVPDPATFRTELKTAQQKAHAEASRARADSMISDLPPMPTNRSRSPSRASEFSVIKLRKIESSIEKSAPKSEVGSAFGKKVISEIPMDMRSEIDERQRSIYSLALKSHLSKNTKRTSRSKEQVQKKNFKKAFLQKKYNTSNLSQLHHKIEKENELQVRELRRLGMVNFSSVMYERREERDAAVELVQERKAFDAMKESIYREISQPSSNPLLEEQNVTAFLPRRQARAHYEDLTSSIENVEIREYEIEESMISEEKEIQTQESIAQYQAIYEAFEGRHHRNNSRHEATSHEREDSSFSRYYASEQQKVQKVAKAIEEHPQEEDSRVYERGYEKYVTADERRTQEEQQAAERQRIQEQQRAKRIIGDQLFGFADHIEFRNNPYFESALRRLVEVASKIRYDDRNIMATTRERVLLLLEELLGERESAKHEHHHLNQKILHYKQRLAEHLGEDGEPIFKQPKHGDEVSRIISQKSLELMVPQGDDALDRTILVQKVVLKKLIQKSCQLFEHNVHRSFEAA